MKNGALLALAEAEFDVFLTSDKNIRYQQNVNGRRIAILVLPTNRWRLIRRNAPDIAEALGSLQRGDFQELTF